MLSELSDSELAAFYERLVPVVVTVYTGQTHDDGSTPYLVEVTRSAESDTDPRCL